MNLDQVLQYQHLSPERKLDLITRTAAAIGTREAPVHAELTIMRLALELQHEYEAARVAEDLAARQMEAPKSLLNDQVSERLATTLEQNQRLRQFKRESQDLLVAKNREISMLRSQVANLETAMKNPINSAQEYQHRQFDQLLRTAPTSRG